MEQDEIIWQNEVLEMATKVWGKCDWHESALCHLEAFAKLVEERTAAKEREACAKVCDELNFIDNGSPVGIRASNRHCSAAIRARGEA